MCTSIRMHIHASGCIDICMYMCTNTNTFAHTYPKYISTCVYTYMCMNYGTELVGFVQTAMVT